MIAIRLPLLSVILTFRSLRGCTFRGFTFFVFMFRYSGAFCMRVGGVVAASSSGFGALANVFILLGSAGVRRAK